MIEVNYLIDCLEKTPVILKSLLSQTPGDLIRAKMVSMLRGFPEE